MKSADKDTTGFIYYAFEYNDPIVDVNNPVNRYFLAFYIIQRHIILNKNIVNGFFYVVPTQIFT